MDMIRFGCGRCRGCRGSGRCGARHGRFVGCRAGFQRELTTRKLLIARRFSPDFVEFLSGVAGRNSARYIAPNAVAAHRNARALSRSASLQTYKNTPRHDVSEGLLQTAAAPTIQRAQGKPGAKSHPQASYANKRRKPQSIT